jgi:hypothetical protein
VTEDGKRSRGWLVESNRKMFPGGCLEQGWLKPAQEKGKGGLAATIDSRQLYYTLTVS